MLDARDRQTYRSQTLLFRGKLAELRADLRELRLLVWSLTPDGFRLRRKQLRDRASELTAELATLKERALWLQAESLITRVRSVESQAQVAEREQLRLGLKALSQGAAEHAGES